MAPYLFLEILFSSYISGANVRAWNYFFGEGSKSKDEQDPLIEDDDKLSNLIEEGKPVLSLVPLRRQNGKRVWYGIVLGGFR